MTLRASLIIDGENAGAKAAIEGTRQSLNQLSQATENNTRQTVNNGTASRAAAANRTNLIFQLNDVFVSLTSGQKPMMVLIQQGSQMLPIYGSIGKLFAEIGKLAVGLITKFAPIAIVIAVISAGIGLLTGAINDSGKGIKVSFGDTALAILQTLGDYIWNVIGPAITAIGGWFKDIWDKSWPVIKDFGNTLIGTFVGALAAIKAVWGTLPNVLGEIVINAANTVLGGLETMINGSIDRLNDVKNFFHLPGEDVGHVKLPEVANPFKGSGADMAKKAGDAFSEGTGTDYLGNMFDDIADHARENAANNQKKKKKGAESDYSKELTQIRERTAAIIQETNVIGLSTFASEKAKKVLELETAAKKDAIGLTPARIKQIDAEAAAYARAVAQQEQVQQAYDFGKQTLNSFFSDLLQGAKQGQSALENFGNAVGNVFDRIAERALGMAADGIWDLIFGAVSGAVFGGGGFGSLGNDIGSGATFGQLQSFIGKNAKGTKNWGGGLTWVGEEGPELLNLPGGSQIFSNGDSRQMAAGGGGFTYAPVNQFSVTGGQADIPTFERLMDERDARLQEQFADRVAYYIAHPMRKSG